MREIMNVFIMHVGDSNTIDLEYTVSQTRSIQEVVDLLPDDAPEKNFFAGETLRSCFPKGMFNCWGVPVGAKGSFERTNVGDLVLFAPKIGSQGGIDYFGFVKAICRESCYASSRILWPETPNDRLFPWLFFFDTERGHIPWDTFLKEVEYKSNWNPRGWYRRIEANRFKVWGGGQEYAQHLRSEFGFSPIAVPQLDIEFEIAETIDVVASIAGKPRKSSRQGFQSTPEIRRAIELKAMSIAIDYFQKQGWTVEDVSQRESYDLRCTRQGEEVYVEVKGTTSKGFQILLTPNEVLHTQKNYPNTALFIVSHLQVNNSAEKLDVTGGEIKLVMPWLLKDSDLKPIAYECQVSQV